LDSIPEDKITPEINLIIKLDQHIINITDIPKENITSNIYLKAFQMKSITFNEIPEDMKTSEIYEQKENFDFEQEMEEDYADRERNSDWEYDD
jgi:hypothetical protein